MKILYLSPNSFGAQAVLGGGERYALGLAQAMSEQHEVCFLSFGKKSSTLRGKLKEFSVSGIHSPLFWTLLSEAEIIHCFQPYRPATDAAVLYAQGTHKKLFLTDLGGWGRYALAYHFPLYQNIQGFLHLSKYAKKIWDSQHPGYQTTFSSILYGGLSPENFLIPQTPEAYVLFVGRIVSHKGIEHLMTAVGKDIPLKIVGKVYDPIYFEKLKKQQTSNIEFLGAVEEAALKKLYQQALVTVQPSVHVDCFGSHTKVPELLGLSALESQAAGTPVIVSNAGSLPEIVQDGVTGFVTPEGSPEALREKILWLKTYAEERRKMSLAGPGFVKRYFSWDHAVHICLEAYTK